jgi:signal transduction histidine kinase
MMLYEFIAMHRDEIVTRTRTRVRGRPWPSVSTVELEHGVPLFLTQLSETLRLEAAGVPIGRDTIGPTATRHGAELLAGGFSITQVVHDYGDICQVITELAVEQHAPITVEEFHTLNRCLDTAIAEAVTEYARLTAQNLSAEETERLGHAAHEMRDLLNGALLAFHALKRGAVAINGSTGAVLGRSLTGLQTLVDRTLSEVRLAAGRQRRERVDLTTFVAQIAAGGDLHAEERGVRFTVVPVDPAWAIDGDPQLLASAVMNSVAQRLQVHACRRRGRPQGACAAWTTDRRGRGRVRRHPRGLRGPFPAVRGATRPRSLRAGPRAVDRAAGGAGARRRHRDP